jgi:hypothetical protein
MKNTFKDFIEKIIFIIEENRIKVIIFIAILLLFASIVFWSFVSSAGVRYFAETLAILVGGGWAFYRFALRRERKPALDIDIDLKTIPDGEGRFLAYFDVIFTNKSKRQVLARIRKLGKPSFSDKNETLSHSCSLLIRQLTTEQPLGKQIHWFSETKTKSTPPTDIVINLLDEYEYDVPGKKDFWIEPSEVSHFGVGVILQPGTYLAMVTFVGQPKDDSEFWRRQFIIKIPNESASIIFDQFQDNCICHFFFIAGQLNSGC